MSKESRLSSEQAFDEASKIKLTASEVVKGRIKKELGVGDTELQESYTDKEIERETTGVDYESAHSELASAEKQEEFEKKYTDRFSKELWSVIDIDDRILDHQQVLNDFYEQRKDGEGKIMRESFSDSDTELEKSLRDKEKELKNLKIDLSKKLDLFEFGHFGHKPSINDEKRFNELRAKGINVGKVEYSYVRGAGESEDGYLSWPASTIDVYRIVFLAKDKDKLPPELVSRLEKSDREFRKYELAQDGHESGNLDIGWEEKYPQTHESEVSPFPREGRVLQAKIVKNEFGVTRVWINKGYYLKRTKQSIDSDNPINEKKINSEILEELELDKFMPTLTSLVDVEAGVDSLPSEFYLKVSDGKYHLSNEEEYDQYEENELKKEKILGQEVDRDWDKKLDEIGEILEGELVVKKISAQRGDYDKRVLELKVPGTLKVRRKEKIDGGKKIVIEEKPGLVTEWTTNVFDNRPEGVKKENYLGVYKFKPEYQRSGRYRGQIYFRQIDEEADSRPVEIDPRQVELAKTAVAMEGLVSQHDDEIQLGFQMYAVKEADGLYHAYVGEPGNLIPLKGFKSKATAESAKELIEIYKETGMY